MSACALVDSGLLHEGDELREVNGVPMEDKNPEEVIPILVHGFIFHWMYVSACSFDPHLCFLFISLWDLLHDSNLRFVSFYWNRISLSHLPGTVRWGRNLQSDPRHQRRAGSRWHRGNMHPAIRIPACGRRGFLWFNLQHRIIRTKWKGGGDLCNIEKPTNDSFRSSSGRSLTTIRKRTLLFRVKTQGWSLGGGTCCRSWIRKTILGGRQDRSVLMPTFELDWSHPGSYRRGNNIKLSIN